MDGLSAVEEDMVLEKVRVGALNRKVGKFPANTFFGKVTDLCWGALRSVSW